MKKTISLILSLVMLLSVTSGLSFNAFAVTDPITAVSYTVPGDLEPVAGKKPNEYNLSSVSVVATGSLFGVYSINSCEYQVKENNGWFKVSPDTAFEVGKAYRLKVSSKSSLQNNDTHSANLTCKINDITITKADGEVDATSDFFYLNNLRTVITATRYYGMLTEEISGVTVTGAPEIDYGKDVVINPYQYHISDHLEFTNITIEYKDGTEWKNAVGSKYACNTKYRFVIDVKTDGGYTLKNNFTAAVKTDIANRSAQKTEIKDGGKAGRIYCEFPNVTKAHTYGTEGDARFTCTVCGAVDEAKKAEIIAKETPATTTTPTTTTPTTTTVKNPYTLTFSSISKIKKSAKKTTIKLTLKKNGKIQKNKKVTLTVAGKTYTAKTNKKGVATFTIKKAAVKKLKVNKKTKLVAKYGKNITKTKQVKVVK